MHGTDWNGEKFLMLMPVGQQILLTYLSWPLSR